MSIVVLRGGLFRTCTFLGALTFVTVAVDQSGVTIGAATNIWGSSGEFNCWNSSSLIALSECLDSVVAITSAFLLCQYSIHDGGDQHTIG